MASISVSSNIKQVKKKLTRIQKRQIPFAVANALNDVAFMARDAEMNAQRQYLDKPTSFTNKGFQVRKATKRSQKATLLIPMTRWKYLKYKVQGGVNAERQQPIPVSRSLRNAHGNLPRTKTRTLLNNKKHFTATINGTSGIWRRETKKRLPISLQVVWKSKTKHKRSYSLWKASRRVVEAKFPHVFDKRMGQALMTAR